MVEFDFIKAILTNNPKIILEKSKIVLEEKQESVKGRENVVQRIKIDEEDIDDIVVYKFANENGEIDFPFFSKGKNTPKLLRKFCDYIIICTCKKKLFVVLVELKAADKENFTENFKKAKKQLDATEVFMKYIFETFERIKHDNDNKKTYNNIENCSINLNICIKKSVFLSDINQTTSTNRGKNASTNKIYCDGYYRCDLAVVDTFQLKSILLKKKSK